MTLRQLTLAAVLLIVALTPSIADVIQAHQTSSPHRALLWGWIALAAVVALMAGEEMTGGSA